jgi:DNA-binding response OmpR family regulator
MSRKTAVIIEDNTEISDLYVLTLQMAHFKTERYVDGKEALDRLQAITPDLVVLDMNLPQVSGHYIYKKIRSEPRLNATRVIIATANNIVARAMADDLAPQDYLLIKPISIQELRDLAEEMGRT